MIRNMFLMTVWFVVLLCGTPALYAQDPGAPTDDSVRVSQSALLEATRQDMIAYRLNRVARKFEYLARDLRSNQSVADDPLNKELAGLADRVKAIQTNRVASLRDRLNELADDDAPPAEELLEVRRGVREVVRELAMLLLEAGVRHATDVFTTRLEDIMETQQRLMETDGTPENDARTQRSIAKEIEELLGKMRSLRRPLEKPLAAVRLARARKQVEKADPVTGLRAAADAMKSNESVQKVQSRVLGALRKALDVLRTKTDSADRKAVTERRVTAASRLEQLNRYQDRQLDLASDLNRVASGKRKLRDLPEVAKRQLEDVRSLAEALPDDGKWTPSIRAPLQDVEEAMKHAVSALENGEAKKAARESKTVIGSFREAADVLDRKVKMLQEVESHLKLADDMRTVAGYVSDVNAEQKDLSDEESSPEEKSETQRVVRGATGKLLETVGGITDAAPVEKPMREAKDRMTALLKNKDLSPSEADRRRNEAAEALGTAGKRADSLAQKAKYVAEWLQYLGDRQAALLSLLARQIELRRRTEDAPVRVFGELREEQDILLTDTRNYAEGMEVGTSHYEKAATEMAKAKTQLKAKDRKPAIRHQRRAEEALRAAAEELASMVDQVAEITTLESMKFFDVETHILTRVMMIAVEQKHIRQRTRKATEKQMSKFTWPEQMHLMRQTRTLASNEELSMFAEIDSLPEAADEMEAAGKALKSAARSDAIEHQQKAEKLIRADIAALVGELMEVQDVTPAKEGNVAGGDGMIVNTSMPMESVRTFGKPPPHVYEKSESGRSTWEPLSPRQRAALSENFARELPLSYRNVLKAYYQSIAE